MGMTMTQKILAAHAGLDSVEPGQLILVNLDRVLGNDITSPVAIREFNKLNKDNVFDKDKVTMVMDHFAPNKDIKQLPSVKCAVISAAKRRSPTSTTWDKWASNTLCCRKKDWSFPVTLSSAQTPTPAPTAHWAHSLPASARPTWRAAWRSARHGSRCRLPSSLSSRAS